MAILAQIDNITKSYGDRMLLDSISFGINEGDKIGLIAKNGTGKTTLLRIIAGKEEADSGTIVFRNDLRLAILEQNPVFADDSVTAANAAPELGNEASETHSRYIRLLSGLGVNDTSVPLAKMSGGQRKRVAMARAIATEPQLLILDEPTNHLDITAVEWLEAYLAKARMTLLMVTHDRYFLDRVCSKIIEIDRTHIYTYDGNYDYFLRRRAERISAMSAELDRVNNLLRKEQDWMSRQPQARAGKARYRIEQFYDLKERSRINITERNVDLGNASKVYIGSKIFEARHISKAFGDHVIVRDFSYDFARGEKVGIIGANGIGKSTFVKMLLGLVPQDSGEWNIGETVRFGYYSQDGFVPTPGKRVIDVITDIADDIEYEGARLNASQLLKRFLFDVPAQQKYVETLSGGELCRLHLASVLMRQPNFLILDEPTNDLDIVTLGILEEYLTKFNGCTIIISHDRYFLDNIVDHIFVLEGDGIIRDFPGNYSDYRTWKAEQASQAPTQRVKTQNVKIKTPQRRRRSFKEQREFEALTAEINALSAERASLEAAFAGNSTPDADIAAMSARYSQVKDLLDEKEMRWLELSEIE